MEMRLNERKQQNEHNQKKGIVNRKIIPQTRRNVYPERRFCGHIAETCTRKGGFGYMWEWQGLPAGWLLQVRLFLLVVKHYIVLSEIIEIHNLYYSTD